jgi:hypothetical protein
MCSCHTYATSPDVAKSYRRGFNSALRKTIREEFRADLSERLFCNAALANSPPMPAGAAA